MRIIRTTFTISNCHTLCCYQVHDPSHAQTTLKPLHRVCKLQFGRLQFCTVACEVLAWMPCHDAGLAMANQLQAAMHEKAARLSTGAVFQKQSTSLNNREPAPLTPLLCCSCPLSCPGLSTPSASPFCVAEQSQTSGGPHVLVGRWGQRPARPWCWARLIEAPACKVWLFSSCRAD